MSDYSLLYVLFKITTNLTFRIVLVQAKAFSLEVFVSSMFYSYSSINLGNKHNLFYDNAGSSETTNEV